MWALFFCATIISMTDKFPVTLAIRELVKHKVPYTPYLYDYVEKGGSAASSAALGVPEHIVIKTLVMETETKSPLIFSYSSQSIFSSHKVVFHVT